MAQLSESEIRKELIYCLREWGIGDTTGQHNAENHARFQKKVIAAGIEMSTSTMDAKKLEFDDLRFEQFPADFQEAYKYVLRHDTMGTPIFIATDKFSISQAPFFRRYDPNDTEQEYRDMRYGRKKEFKKAPLIALDPLCRFEFEEISEAEFFFQSWFVGDDNRLGGVVMEALLACHAIHQEACFNCKYRHSLRWNGGGRSSWQDLVCIKCKCMYEVKSKKDMDAIQKGAHYNRLYGGSFYGWSLVNNTKGPDQKIFLVQVPRMPTHTRNRIVFPVQVAEIKKVLPKVHEYTFNPKESCIRLKTEISLNLHTKEHWFDLPCPDDFSWNREDVKRVYCERFSIDAFEKFTDKYFPSDENHSSSAPPPPTVDSDSEPTEPPVQEPLLPESVPDDWEDLLSDSD
eukprot:scaffold3479_cov106-Cylindrotheca_fusiformis.AAC.2